MRLAMDQKTTRIFIKTLHNLGKLLLFTGSLLVYGFFCLWASSILFNDLGFGLAGMFIPLIITAVWDQSKQQVESELYKEENLINTLSKNYEPRI
jgi:hypothetical protein